MTKEKKMMAILYAKQEVPGCDNPTYIFIPTKAISGMYNKKTDILTFNGKEYHSVENDDACLSNEKYYFNGIKDIDKRLSDVAIKKLTKSYLSTENGLVYIKSIGDHSKKGTFNVNEFVDGIVDKEEVEENLKKEIIDAIETLKSGKISNQAKSYIVNMYQTLTKFFEGSIYNGILVDDLSENTIDFLIESVDELDELMDSNGIDPDDVDEYGTPNSLTDEENGETEDKVTINTYDPNKRIYPEYSVEDLYKGITDVVIDQDEQVMEIVTYLYKRLTALELPYDMRDEFGLMVTGNTGVGKTEIFKTLANIVDLPILKMDAKQIVPSGYKGTSVEDKLKELYQKYNGDMKKISRAFILLDEVDKIAEKGNNSEVSGGAVQDIFLKFMDGTDYNVELSPYSSKIINTSDMTPISMGAYIDLYKNKERKLGFGKDTPEDEKKRINQLFVDVGGMKKEWMGRQKRLVHLNDLNLSSLIKIMSNSKKSPLVRQAALYKAWGVDAEYTPGYTAAVAKEAMLLGTGARGLSSEVEATTSGPVSEISKNRGKYHKVIFTEKTVEDPKQYILR